MDKDTRRQVLSGAAVFEGAFSIDWVIELTGEKALTVLSALEYGCGKQWLEKNEVGIFRFIDAARLAEFRSELSACDSRDLHARALEILSRELPDEPGKTGRLTTHLLKISNTLAGCRLLVEQGNTLRRDCRTDQAKRYYDKALEDLEALAGSGRDPASGQGSDPDADPVSDPVSDLFIDLTLQYAKIWTASQSYKRAQSTLTRAIARAKALGKEGALSLLRLHLAHQELFFGSYEEAKRQVDLARSMIERSDSPSLIRALKLFNMFLLYWQGKFTQAFASYETYVPTIETRPESRFDCIARLIAGHATGLSGNISQAMGMIDSVHQHSTKTGDLGVASYASLLIGSLLGLLNRFGDAADYYEKALEEARASHSYRPRIYALLSLAHVRFRQDRTADSLAHLEEYLELSQKTRFISVQDPFLLEMGWAMDQGDYPRVKGVSLELALEQTRNSPNIFMKGMAGYFQAKSLEARKADPNQIISTLESAMENIRASGNLIQLARAGFMLARRMQKMKQQTHAVEIAAPLVKSLYAIDKQLIPDDFSFLIKASCDQDVLLKEILQLGQEIADMRNPKELLAKIISTVNQITGAERGAIFLAEEKGGGLVLEAAKNLPQEEIESEEFKASMAIVRQTAQGEKGGIFAPEKKDGIRSVICVPMRVNSRLIGVLYHDNRLFKSVFRESDLEILNYFAAQAAISIDNARVCQTLETLYQKEKEEKEYYEEQFKETLAMGEIVGKSQAMAQVFSLIESVAKTDTTVLITGETGVGKELVARALHKNSGRSQGPFIRVNCAALPESLIASELFGHEKGAFTGATKQRIGRFELADQGTLFLDEIGDISPYIQVRLLRVLQNQEFERVGSQKTIRSNFRLITATNKDLKKEVGQGGFREDLFYRLNIFPIRIPALRDRTEDIPVLVRHFLEKSCDRLNKVIHKVPQKEIDALTAYAWPGNIRELENIVERGVILSRGGVLSIPRTELTPPSRETTDESEALADVERRHIMKVLKQTRGKINGASGAAEILQLHPSTLRFRIKKLGLTIERKTGFQTHV